MTNKFVCPSCSSKQVAITEETMFMVNTLDHYCHSVKFHDSDAKATCLDCDWVGKREDLTVKPKNKVS